MMTRLETELANLQAKRNDIRELLYATVDAKANADRLKALASVDKAIDRIYFKMAAIELASV